MTTTRQIATNRANALLSTGPRTLEGKAAAVVNAITHGLCAARQCVHVSENPEDFRLDFLHQVFR